MRTLVHPLLVSLVATTSLLSAVVVIIGAVRTTIAEAASGGVELWRRIGIHAAIIAVGLHGLIRVATLVGVAWALATVIARL